ncbi:GNAT family N-acetyltransferase [Pelagibacterium montanilacus]|uniref:GNAT family N-acetyltransferase n=1 Tax=Pelagibacterium montanilacus TaxID=2185280 RepID=UPI0013E082F1|nr:GNAT family N-acyltransferase [Pelagibacterium montanilacus]
MSLARTAAELRAAQRLRYEVFVAELDARPPGADRLARLEADRFDPHCDHIIVRDRSRPDAVAGGAIVGACRVQPPEAAGEGFSSQAEFDIAPLLARHAGLRFCEVGRSCVARTHRTQRTIEVLWYGLWAYACRAGIDVYFGTASLPGADPERHRAVLAYLHARVGAPRDWAVDALGGGAVAMEGPTGGAMSRARALRAMPPLLRGYLRVNAHVGRSAFLDTAFSTTDVLVIARLALMPTGYRDRARRVTGLDLPKPSRPVGIPADLQ